MVGLSASLTYAVDHKAVVQALANLCHDLSISKMISPTEEELKKSGYVPQDDSIETMHKPWAVPDGVMPGKCDQAISVTKRAYFQNSFLLCDAFDLLFRTCTIAAYDARDIHEKNRCTDNNSICKSNLPDSP